MALSFGEAGLPVKRVRESRGVVDWLPRAE
jgi:hypothetical protein